MEQILNHKTLESADFVEATSNECPVEAVSNASSTNYSISSMYLKTRSTRRATAWGGHSILLTSPYGAPSTDIRCGFLLTYSTCRYGSCEDIRSPQLLAQERRICCLHFCSKPLYHLLWACSFAWLRQTVTHQNVTRHLHTSNVRQISFCHEWKNDGKLLHLVCVWPFILPAWV